METFQLQGRTVCVTGAAGFIGQRLVKRLLAGGTGQIVCFEHQGGNSSGKAFSRVGHSQKRLRRVFGDILNLEDLERAIEPESFVIHLAGMTHAGLSLQVPETCFEVNAHGTVRVLEACRLQRAAGFLFVSTGLVYGIPMYEPVNELHPTAPLAPYAASKLAAEAAVFAYAGNYHIPTCIARLANVYGPGGHPDAVHSIIRRQLVSGGPVELLDLSSVRDFIYVDDVVEGLFHLSESLRPGTRQVVNLSSGQGHSIETLARCFAEAHFEESGERIEIRQKGSGNLSSVRSLILDNQRLIEMTNWRPQYTLQEGARMSIKLLRAGVGSGQAQD